MSTLLKCDAVFLHVPKTGGMYVRRLLQAMDMIRFDFSRDHSDMQHTLHTSQYFPGNFYLRSLQLGTNLDSHVRKCYKFCVVRNPIDWYVSYWRYMTDLNWKSMAPTKKRTRFGFRYDQWHPLVPLEAFANGDFNQFVAGVTEAYPGFLSNMYAAYADPAHISFVAKQETLTEDLKQIFQQLNLPYQEDIFARPGRVNESRTEEPICTKATRDLIIGSEQESFVRYGYTL